MNDIQTGEPILIKQGLFENWVMLARKTGVLTGNQCKNIVPMV